MDDASALAAEIRRSVSDEAWFGPSVLKLFNRIDAVKASQHVEGAAHSIWQLALPLSVWARYATYRFEGGVPRDLERAGYSRRVAAGLAQHAAYHAGQVAAIRRFGADRAASV